MTKEVAPLTEKQEAFLREYVFFDGWNDHTKLNYLPKDEIESYKKKDDKTDSLQYCIDIYGAVKRHKIKSDEWLETIYYPIPKTDKEIDYFLDNNLAYGFILYWCLQQIIDVTEKKLEIIKREVQEIERKALDSVKEDVLRAKNNIEWLIKRGNKEANEFAKVGVKEFDDIVERDDTKPKGSSKKTLERNDDVRRRYYKIVETLIELNGIKVEVTPKMAQEMVAKELGMDAKYVKKIIYSEDKPQKPS
jgi:hypothetical protein